MQTEERVAPFPAGSSGWHSIQVCRMTPAA